MAERTVNPRYYPFKVTVAANTPAAAPVTSTPAVDAGMLDEIELTIPTGHAGLTGIRFTLAGVTILPWAPGVDWIIADGLDRSFGVGVEIDQGLRVVTYNTDAAYAHTFYMRFKIRDITAASTAATATTVVPITASAP